MKSFFTQSKLRRVKQTDRILRAVIRRRPTLHPPAIVDGSRILLVESHHIGDHVMRMAAFRAIREQWPAAHIALLTNRWGKQLLASQGLFDEYFVTSFPWVKRKPSLAEWRAFAGVVRQIRRGRFDVAVDFRGDIRNNFLLACVGAPTRVGYDFMGGDYFLTHSVPYTEAALSHEVVATNHVARHIGCRDVPPYPRYDLSIGSQQALRESLARRYPLEPGARRVGIYIVTAIKVKEWSLPEGRRLLTRIAEEYPSQFLLFGDHTDVPSMEGLLRDLPVEAAIVQVPLSDLPAALSLCDLFVGVDSGPAHIAEAVGVPTVVLFGSTSPELFGPRSPSSRVVKASPCDCELQGRQECIRPLGERCLDQITGEQVFTYFNELIEAEGGIDKGCQEQHIGNMRKQDHGR